MCRRSVFDRFRAIAHEGEVDKRVQFTIEELYRVRARGFEAEGFAAVIPSLDLVRVICSSVCPQLGCLLVSSVLQLHRAEDIRDCRLCVSTAAVHVCSASRSMLCGAHPEPLTS